MSSARKGRSVTSFPIRVGLAEKMLAGASSVTEQLSLQPPRGRNVSCDEWTDATFTGSKRRFADARVAINL
ncbi:hypothetical protein GCM10009872_52880 [Actinopolymorpha rutila]